MYDTIIIGGGPAGVSSAIYLKRFNLNPLIITTKNSSLNKAKIENFYGQKSIDGKELFELGLAQAKSLEIDIKIEEVTSIEFINGGFNVKSNLSDYQAKTIILSTGKSRKKLDVSGLEKLLGSGVSQCAVCDGFFYRNKSIVIIGNSSYMKEELEVLSRFTNDIKILTNGLEFESDKYPVIKSKIISFNGDTKLESITLSDQTIKADGAFIAIGQASALDFAAHLGIAVKDNNIVVKDYMTNIPGIFAAGDSIGGILQVSKAVSDGTAVAFKIKEYLNKKL